ncbi:MAG TPA: hypothetical protein VJB57_11055 [Dehalococcoidia bacterium]|nr:hypothetical protein [Dehalococcoidia bacterium]
MATRYRADQVGSFLRPPAVKEAHIAHAEGRLTLEKLREVEDAAILELLEMQKQVGIDVFADGELRRNGWASGFGAAVEGYVPGRPSVQLRPELAGMPQRPPVAPTPGAAQNAGPRVLGAPLKQLRRLTGHESAFLRQHAPGPWKVTMPAASYITARGYNPEISDKVFGSRAGLLKAVGEIINAEIKALMDEGCPYIQLDNPHYTDYVPDERREQYKAIGIDPDQAMREDVEADNACLAGVDRSKVTIGMHFCRGNTPGGGWHTAGGYDRIAEIVFGGLDVDAFLLEYDSDRAGTFEPLRYMPKGKTAVLGLVTTKSGALESQELLLQRIQEASKYMDLDDMTLSPQCGFSSTFQGNPLTAEEQRRKLQLVVETARKVWK